MSVFDQDIGCCGASFEKNKTSFLGLLTFSVTAMIVLVLVYFVTLPLYLFSSKFHNLMKIIFNANKDLLKKNNILRKSKCQIAGKLLRYSARLSGLFFNYFNYTIFFSCWLVLLGTILWVTIK